METLRMSHGIVWKTKNKHPQPTNDNRPMTNHLPDRYLAAVRLFNDEEFFECHDVLEELWTETMSEERRFYQGLIQAAVALFHFGNGNLGGARKLYHSSSAYLKPYRLRYMGLDVAAFLDDFKDCFQELLDAGETYPANVVLRDERIPRIDLTSDVPDES